MSIANILIATPCSGEMVSTEYVRTIFKLLSVAPTLRPSVTFSLRTVSIADVYKARNLLAAVFMADERFTHLLFIDSDMGFGPNLLLKMLRRDQPFVSALYPYRKMDIKRFHELAREIEDPALAERLSLDFVSAHTTVSEAGSEGLSNHGARDGFVRVRTAGAGIMLLKREVFATLKGAYPDLITRANQMPYNMLGMKKPVLQCFSALRTEDGNFLSEDVSFCFRWTSCGGDIWACVDEDVTHVGQAAFRSSYIDRMVRGMLQK